MCINKSHIFVCLFTQVLEEAQEMAVRNYNVEYKSNLYVGKCLHHWWVLLRIQLHVINTTKLSWMANTWATLPACAEHVRHRTSCYLFRSPC